MPQDMGQVQVVLVEMGSPVPLTLQDGVVEMEATVAVVEAAAISMEWQICHVIQNVDDLQCKGAELQV